MIIMYLMYMKKLRILDEEGEVVVQDKKGQMIFSNFMSVLYVVIIFVAIFFITYSVFKIKSTISGPMSFKSAIDFKNSFTDMFLFSKSLEFLNVQNNIWGPNDDNITTFETLMMINIINATDGNNVYLYDNEDGNGFEPSLNLFFNPKRFYFVYPSSDKYFGGDDWEVMEAERSLCANNYYGTGNVVDCGGLFPEEIGHFVNSYLQDPYGFKSFEFPIFFRRFRGYIFISNDVNVPIPAGP